MPNTLIGLVVVIGTLAGPCLAGAEEQGELFPLAVGNTWTYVSRVARRGQPPLSVTQAVTVRGVETLEGKRAFLLEQIAPQGVVSRREFLHREGNQLVCMKRITYTVAERGLVHGFETIHEPGEMIEREDPGTPEVILELPLTSDQHWVSQGTYYDVHGTERVEVPAGVFECWKVKLFAEGEDAYIYKYYAEGIGLVKDELYKVSALDDVVYPIVTELVAYQFADPQE